MSLKIMSWVLEESDAKLGARLVLLALAEYAHDDGTKAFPSVETLAQKARLSERGTRDALRKLESDGMIVSTGSTKYGTRIYSVVCPFNPRGGADSAGGSMQHKGGQDAAQQQLQTAPDQSVESVLDPSEKPLLIRARIQAAWLEAPGMIQHRDSYFADDSVRRLIEKVVRKYGVEDVAAAIQSYASVLASPRHFFKHRWTFADFLNRGLDRFVPEADPERVFLQDAAGTAKPGSAFAGDLSRFDT